MLEGWYSVGYVQERDPAGHLNHRFVYAAWWKGEPCAKPWRSPDSTGLWLHSDHRLIYHGGDRWAEEQADRDIRGGLSGVHCMDVSADSWKRWKAQIATHKIDPAWARAAYREKAGKAPNYRKPKGKTTFYGGTEWAKRPPTQPVREFFSAKDEEYRRWEAEYGHLIDGLNRGRSEANALGLTAPYSTADVNRAYRKIVSERRLHPDQGGDGVEFSRVTAVRDAALRGASA